MEYQVIARKFRPQRFEDVVGQEHVTRVIKNAIDLGRIPHAFVFSGPRGVGKTTVARILAKALNCEEALSSTPCGTCRMCEDIAASRAVDVFEIDAASHTGVDNIRELIENARYAPTSARYKTFIIDEVHMLSKSAFNALLKTLEEPPPHAVFIMATTELNKIPPTVLSRCQRYDFRRIAVEDIMGHLSRIALQEEIEISEDALMLIALQSDGGMRDAQGMLEHVASGAAHVTRETVEQLLGLVGSTIMHQLLTAIVERDVSAMLETVSRVHQHGQDLGQLYRSLMESFRNMLVLKSGYENVPLPSEERDFYQKLIADVPLEELHRSLSVLIRAEADFKYSSLPKITLETVLLRIISAPSLVDLSRVLQMVESGQSLPRGSSVPAPPRPAPRPSGAAAPAHASSAPAASPAPAAPVQRLPAGGPRTWAGFLAWMKNADKPLFAMLERSSLLQESEAEVTLSASNKFFAEQLRKETPDIQARAREFFQHELRIKVEVSQNNAHKPRPAEVRTQALNTPVVKEVIAEFDGMVKDVRPRE